MTEYKKSLPQLFFPIFFENFFAMLTGMVDTLMLSMEGDQAVGAVGTANTYISIFVIMFSIISSGMIAVMTQYIGARRPGVAQRAMRLGQWASSSAVCCSALPVPFWVPSALPSSCCSRPQLI